MKSFFKQFGGKVTSKWKDVYARSDNWKSGRFRNLEPTDLSTSIWKIPSIAYKQFSSSKERRPASPIPIIPYNEKLFLTDASRAKFIWYGHSALLMNVQGKIIFIDPMLGPDTSPIAPIASKRFSKNALSIIQDIPEIDIVLITHDHYDHLDLASITKLKDKVNAFIVAFGVKRHLVAWGVESDKITECDWWDEHKIDDIEITFTPTKHFSGRGLTDRMKTLWGGWVIKSDSENIWFSGDGGYGNHFKEIGKKKGPFDIGFMECGQYNVDWYDIHMFPEEAIKASIDAGVKYSMPVHWGGFDLSYQHTWYEPAEEFVAAAMKYKLQYVVPPIGQVFSASDSMDKKWWQSYL